MVKVAVFGAGGVGGYFGARLAAAGHEVHFIARGAHAKAMREKGLVVRAAVGEVRVPAPKVSEDPAAIGPVDYVLFCVKLWDIDSAAAACRALIGPGTAVISLQNGVDAEAALGAVLGREHVMGAICQISAAIAEPGVIQQTGDFARLVVGELDGRLSERLARLEQAFALPGVEFKASAEIEVEIWRKFVFLAPLAGATGFYRQPVGAIREDADKRARFEALVREAVAVGRAQGVALAADTEAQTLGFFDQLPAGMKASMLVDLERGNRIELPWLTGAVVKLGERLGVEVPVSRLVYDALAPFAAGNAA
jgi:2-dehydropantoate 2-reductase